MISLVSMPLSTPSRPSIALGLLKACLSRENLPCRSYHAYVHFLLRLGPALHRALESTLAEELIGDWLFGGVAFPDFAAPAARLLEGASVDGLRAHFGPEADLAACLEEVRIRAGQFVEETALAVLVSKPRIVACTSTFQQQVASLALLRRIKELSPETITVLGGANCEGPMGVAVARSFPWLDFVVSGEADELVGPFFASLLEGKPRLLEGVIAQGQEYAVSEAPRAVVNNLRNLPSPDYDDYFAEYDQLQMPRPKNPLLLVETSRGCWWGQKHHCTFCGLNGKGMNFRAKTPEQALRDFDGLSKRYDSKVFYVVDNILDLSYFKTVLPELEKRDYSIFYETKANLKREQMEQLARSGIRYLQPGIESLHDQLLKLMDKGTTALQNVQILRWARELGIDILWLNLFGFPGEDHRWYGEMAEWLPLISHLQAPRALVRVTFQRFSPYHKRPEEYGLHLRPHRQYARVYPLPESELVDLAYNFEDESRDLDLGRYHYEPGFQALRGVFRSWSNSKEQLSMRDEGFRLVLEDSRAVAREARYELDEVSRQVYLACDQAVSRAQLVTRLAGVVEESLVLERVALLVEQRLLLELNGRVLALAVPDRTVRGMEVLEALLAQQAV